MKKIFELKLGGFDILLLADRADFAVHYGKQVRSGLSYAEAAKELGEAILHALAIEGRI